MEFSARFQKNTFFLAKNPVLGYLKSPKLTTKKVDFTTAVLERATAVLEKRFSEGSFPVKRCRLNPQNCEYAKTPFLAIFAIFDQKVAQNPDFTHFSPFWQSLDLGPIYLPIHRETSLRGYVKNDPKTRKLALF